MYLHIIWIVTNVLSDVTNTGHSQFAEYRNVEYSSESQIEDVPYGVNRLGGYYLTPIQAIRLMCTCSVNWSMWSCPPIFFNFSQFRIMFELNNSAEQNIQNILFFEAPTWATRCILFHSHIPFPDNFICVGTLWQMLFPLYILYCSNNSTKFACYDTYIYTYLYWLAVPSLPTIRSLHINTYILYEKEWNRIDIYMYDSLYYKWSDRRGIAVRVPRNFPRCEGCVRVCGVTRQHNSIWPDGQLWPGVWHYGCEYYCFKDSFSRLEKSR